MSYEVLFFFNVTHFIPHSSSFCRSIVVQPMNGLRRNDVE